MQHKKFMIILILLIFTTGMIMGTASASHTYKKGKYKCTISNKEYYQMKQGKVITKKVGYKYKWKTKKMKTYESWYDSNGNLYKSKSWSPYKKWGYNIKYIKSVWRYYDDGSICWEYYKVGKKVKAYMHLEYFNGKVYKTVDTSKYVYM